MLVVTTLIIVVTTGSIIQSCTLSLCPFIAERIGFMYSLLFIQRCVNITHAGRRRLGYLKRCSFLCSLIPHIFVQLSVLVRWIKAYLRNPISSKKRNCL